MFTSGAKSTFRVGIRLYVVLQKLISFSKDGHIFSPCSDFGFAIEIDIALSNSDFKSVSDFI